MSVGGPQYHHRSTTKSANKAFKSRHSTKSAIKERSKGKVPDFEKGVRRTPHQQVMSKFDRRNQAKQRRVNHASAREERLDVFKGRDGAPRIIAVIPLCEDVAGKAVAKSLLESVDVDEEAAHGNIWRAEVPRFKQKVQYLMPKRDLWECIDAARMADFVLFVLSAEEEVDELGEQMLRCIESQGVSTVLTGVHNLNVIEPAKKRPDVLKSLKSFMAHFFAALEKVHDLSSRQDCSNAMRSLCTTTPKGIRWREDRSWMLLEDSNVQDQGVILTGVVRGRSLKADRLVQVGDWGDFQIEKIVAAPIETKSKSHKNAEVEMGDGGEQIVDQPTEGRDDLAELAPEDMVEDSRTIAATSIAPSDRKAVLLDDHHYFDEDEDEALPKPKRLPRGTSKYQAAWYLGDMSDSGSDLETVDGSNDEDMEMDGSIAAGPADGHFDDATMREPTEFGAPSEYPQSEAFNDNAPEDEAEEIAAYRKKRRDDAEDDLEFPDEIELHPHMNARERLAKYRGLKSLRTSQWETEEDAPYRPEEWQRLLEIRDYKAAKNRVLKDTLTGGVKSGTRVQVYLRIPSERLEEVKTLSPPTALFSLLKHEHKRTACNHSMSLSAEYEQPLKSKQQILLQCGPRRLLINPLFSQLGNTPNDVHKFDRFLHPGQTAVASFIGPVTWGHVPCLYFKKTAAPEHAPADAIEDLASAMEQQQPSKASYSLIATGTSLAPSTSRVIAKRVILTGHPYKIHKKLVTVRYMFFNQDDVNYFRAMQLWTKRGRSGYIKEHLGTHGYFKATFDGKINPLDAVGISLYKRVWPRNAITWRPGKEDAVDEEAPMLVGGDAGTDAMEA
ncbi:DUF663-domain-containing protein [Polychaeton citri CBS 116435]|uniref:DUF663-domain-containing protein n=1 Tax=Polychaeton citri CBS 116435 TaxID=1314669 RepID=A0A9P4QB74_9PEZI|nr:DUF663-domain-containing protein [Polychaeton citri CBS 116435]